MTTIGLILVSIFFFVAAVIAEHRHRELRHEIHRLHDTIHRLQTKKHIERNLNDLACKVWDQARAKMSCYIALAAGCLFSGLAIVETL